MEPSGWKKFVPPDKVTDFQRVLNSRKAKNSRMAASNAVTSVVVTQDSVEKLNKHNVKILVGFGTTQGTTVLAVHESTDAMDMEHGWQVTTTTVTNVILGPFRLVNMDVQEDPNKISLLETHPDSPKEVDIVLRTPEQAQNMFTSLQGYEVRFLGVLSCS